jgi:hypothetical protein
MGQQSGLSNIQLELLKLYGSNIPEKQLFEIRMLLAKYFAEQATTAMEKVWEEKNLTPQDMINWTNRHNRLKNRP